MMREQKYTANIKYGGTGNSTLLDRIPYPCCHVAVLMPAQPDEVHRGKLIGAFPAARSPSPSGEMRTRGWLHRHTWFVAERHFGLAGKIARQGWASR